MCVVVKCLLSARTKIRGSGCGNSFKLNFWKIRDKQIILRLHNGDTDTEQTGFTQLVSCNVKLQLREPSIFPPIWKGKMHTPILSCEIVENVPIYIYNQPQFKYGFA